MVWYLSELFTNFTHAAQFVWSIASSRTILEIVLFLFIIAILMAINEAGGGILAALLQVVLEILGYMFIVPIGIYFFLSPFLLFWFWHLGTIFALCIIWWTLLEIKLKYHVFSKVWRTYRKKFKRT